MKYHKEMLEMGCFSWNDVCELTGNRNSASSLIQSYLKKGYIQNIKRNLYTALDLVTGQSVADKYQIASSLTETSYVYGFSALDYHGYTNQVSYVMYTASETRFKSFEYEGITYMYIRSSIRDGIVKENRTAVTDLERSLLDCIDTFDKYGGIEELLRCVELIPALNEAKLLKYLAEYKKAGLYQKTGYILEHFKHELYLGDGFFAECKKHIGKSTRYLYSKAEMEGPRYNKDWQVIAPERLSDVTYQGGFEDAEI